MEFKTAKTKIESLSERFYFVLLVCVALLISNVLLVGLTAWSFTHQRTTIIPAVLTKPITVSNYSADTSYLRQMGLFFATERLNLTPENVKQNHKILLQYTDPKFYQEFFKILDQEQETIIKQKLSSVFYPTAVIVDPGKLIVYLKGTLNRSVGSLALNSMPKSYLIKFSYSSGILRVRSFSSIGEKNHA